MSLIRLDKLLSNAGIGTRSQVRELIKNGRVTVDGQCAGRPEMKVDEDTAVVCCDRTEVKRAGVAYYMLHKPGGCITAARDTRQPTVMDYLAGVKEKNLAPVGRLDKDTEGLLLITNDGALVHNLLSPRKHVPKTYFAWVSGRVTEDEVKKFQKGLDIGDEKPTMPAELKILESGEQSRIEVTLHEGRYHQVKRMFQAVGMEVLYLKRLSMGPVALDEKLAPGEFRPLTPAELSLLRSATEKDQGGELELEGVIFDLDGTMVDSMGLWHEIDVEYLGARGIYELPESLEADIEGMSFSETAVYFKETFHLSDSLETIKQEWNAMAYEKYASEVPLKPGLKEFLDELRDAGIPCGIASSNSIELITAALRQHDIYDRFSFICTGCMVQKGKPAPDVYLRVAEELGASPENCLVFEDVPMGILSGKNAKMKVCAVEDAFSADQRSEKERLADYYIEDYREIREKLGKLKKKETAG